MKNNLKFLLLTLTLAACGNDRSLEDYNRDKAREDENKIESAVGTYRGELRSTRNNEILGVLQIDLSTNRKVDSLSLEKTTLETSVFFSGRSPIYISSGHTYYDWKSGRVNSEFSMLQSTGKKLTLKMDGAIYGNRLKGEFKVAGYDSHGGEFVLDRMQKRSSAESFFRSGQIANRLLGQDEVNLTYTGEMTANNEESDSTKNASRVSLLISNSDTDPALRFAEIFSPQKSVRAVLTISRARRGESHEGSNGFSLPFNNATWEPLIGTLVADYRSIGSADRSHLSLRCSGLATAKASHPTKLNCRYQSSERAITRDLKLVEELAKP